MIREGTLQDISDLARLGMMMHAESDYKSIPMNTDKGADYLVHVLCNPDKYKVTVAEDSSGVFGMHIGLLQDYWFSDEVAGYDVLLYISPEKRGSLAGIRMIKAFEDWAFSKGAIEVRPGSTTGIAPEVVKELHERLGYSTVGYTFRKVLPCAVATQAKN